ncbi:MAG TPA: DsbA family oxidoreductase [Cyclobacteriaceae bacterium]|nr:DsbA family oxidoreductase [Cyclobacteriaceae bacterium]
MSIPVIKVDIVSDVVCPWCYIGKRRMEKAIKELSGEVEVQLEYHPFELNPDAPKEGRNQREYLIAKFGSSQKYQELTNHVTRVAAEEGLKFDFEKQNISPNTRDAHRIIMLAKQDGKQVEAKEAFMNAYFEEGMDLTKKENLIAVAVKVGLDKNKIAALLDSENGIEEIETEEYLYQQRGVRGVPYFIINNKYGISGAQAADTFKQAFRQVASEVSAV